MHPAVARVSAPGRDTISFGSATLVAVNENHGLVITNWHVVSEAIGPVIITFPDGFRSTGTVQKVDKEWDLAAVAIWRPTATPVKLAAQAPQPGELLTIAGYGSGSYRSVTGRCTQYVAPNQTFPFEMVELAAAARQGDSGGPIFNERGELAGVLFGTGQGRTAGSYCGRVRWFLDDVIAASAGRRTAAEVATLPAGDRAAGTSAPTSPAEAWRGGPSVRQDFRTTRGPVVAAVPRETGNGRGRRVLYPAPQPDPRQTSATPAPGTAQTNPALSTPATVRLGWEDIAGKTATDQVKTVLCLTVVLGIMVQFLRWLAG